MSSCIQLTAEPVNTLRPRQNGRHFPDDILKWIFLNENVWISIEISLNVVPKGQINNISTLVQIMARRRPGDKPLSEPMMVSLLTDICVTQPQWVNGSILFQICQCFTSGQFCCILWSFASGTVTCSIMKLEQHRSVNGLLPGSTKLLIEQTLTARQ